MDPNKSSTLKPRGIGSKFARRIRRITKKFDGETQDVRGKLILDLQQLEEIAWKEATRTKQGHKKTAELLG